MERALVSARSGLRLRLILIGTSESEGLPNSGLTRSVVTVHSGRFRHVRTLHFPSLCRFIYLSRHPHLCISLSSVYYRLYNQLAFRRDHMPRPRIIGLNGIFRPRRGKSLFAFCFLRRRLQVGQQTPQNYRLLLPPNLRHAPTDTTPKVYLISPETINVSLAISSGRSNDLDRCTRL